jgi:exodeoxyribonuclease VII small subunit
MPVLYQASAKLSEPARETTEGELSFEQSLDELERIVRELEEGRIGLAESLARYEQGVKLLRRCYGLLERAERRIELLSSADSQGRAVTESFDDQALSLEEKAQARSRRRSKKNSLPADAPETESPRTGDVDESGTLF